MKTLFSLGNASGYKTFDLLSFENYAKQNEKEILTQILCGFKSREYLNTLHISNSKEYEEIDTTPTADTSTVAEFSSIDVNMPQHYKVNISLCTIDLIRKYNFDLASGIINNEDEFVKKIVDRIVTQTQNHIENYIWTGNVEECNMNGLLTLANSNEQTIKAPKGSTTWETLCNVIKNIPSAIKDKVKIFCGEDMYREVALYIKENNLMDSNDIDLTSISIPDTTYKLCSVSGLTLTGQFLAADPTNLIYVLGNDEVNTPENEKKNLFKIEYYQPNAEYRVYILININAQIVFPDQVVVSERLIEFT